jgi:hypothetical protein
MAVRWARVNVFISSTFNDMHAERDYLVKRVIPDLQEWCERHKLRLIDVDLRWGVTEEDATRNRNVIPICLHNIDECRPFFLCFLGQRVGWIPQPNDVSPETLERYPPLRGLLGQVSVTEMEVKHSLRDPDSVAGAYCYFRIPSYLDDLPAIPPLLRAVYVDPGGPPQRVEALAATIEAATGRPARRYQAQWRQGDTTPELALPLACPSTFPENVTRWQKAWQAAIGIDITGTAIPDPSLEAARLYNQSLVRGRLGDFTCEGRSLGEVIRQDLQEALKHYFPDHAEGGEEDDLQRELDQHELFLFEHAGRFVHRPGDWADLDDYLGKAADDRPFVLTAPGGQGKSTLLASWINRLQQEVQRLRGGTLHYRFVGASDRSATIDGLLRLLLRELKERHGKLASDIPLEPDHLRQALPDLFAELGRHAAPTVLVIDGVDQLEGGMRTLDWLPCPLPEGVHFVLSCRRGDPEGDALFDALEARGAVLVSRVRPFDVPDDRRRLIDAYLAEYLKQLDAPLREEIIALDGARNPLFLAVVLSELRVFGSFANLREQVNADYGADPVSAFGRMLARLEHDPSASALSPGVTVPLVFGFLAHSRRGLRREELADLVASHAGVQRQEASDAVNVFLRQARSFLARREGRFDFFYDSFRRAAFARYGGPPWHRWLAEYFRTQAVYLPAPNARRAEELPWQLARAGDLAGLEQTLCDLELIEATCRAGMTTDLVADFDAALALGEASERVSAYAAFVSGHANIFLRDPSLVLPFAYNYAPEGPVVEEATRRLAERGGWRSTPWIEVRDRPPLLRRPALVRALEGHRAVVRCVALSADGRTAFSGSDDGTARLWEVATGVCRRRIDCGGPVNGVALTPDGSFAATAQSDGLVRVWDLASGACRATFEGHRGPVLAVALSADARVVVSGGHDGAVRVQVVGQRDPLHVLTGHFGPVGAVAVSPDGERAASGGWDGMTRLWDIPSGRQLRCLEGVPLRVQGVALASRGEVVVTGCGLPPGPGGKAPLVERMSSVVRIWRGWHCVHEGWDHELVARGGVALGVVASAIYAVALTADGALAASVAYDGNLALWDVRAPGLRRLLTAHACPATAVALDAAGDRCVTGAADGALHVWRLDGDWPPARFVERLKRIPLRQLFERQAQGRGFGLLPWPRQPPAPRLGQVGRRGRAPLLEKARLIWKNRKLRIGAVVPGWLLLGFALFYGLTGTQPGWGSLGVFLAGWGGWAYQEWLLSLRSDLHLWKSEVTPGWLQALLGLPWSWAVRVAHCPGCGRLICGRRRLFSCRECGWSG